MADDREQGPTGHGPIGAGPGVQGGNNPAPEEVRSVKVDMGQGPPPAHARTPPPRASGGSGLGMMTAAVLSLLFGGAGAWAYERYLARPAADRPTGAPASQEQEPGARKDLASVEDRIKDLHDQYNHLADQYKQLQARAESAPKSAPAPDLGPIERKVAEVDRLSQEVDAINKKLDPLAQKSEQYETRMADLDRKIDDVRNQGAISRGRMPVDRDRQVARARGDQFPAPSGLDRMPASEAERPSPSARDLPPASGGGTETRPTPAADRGESPDSSFGTAVKQFNEKRYSEAYATFRELLQAQPDDARNWYFGALSYGLATGQWDRATQTMVEEGIAREKAGKPPKAEIDAALAGLTRDNGKDWLDFYRRRAQ